jgi:hypothetical protein
MPSVSQVEGRIADVEGFYVMFVSPDGSDIEDSQIVDYPYVKAASSKWTVTKWANTRLVGIGEEFAFAVLDRDGTVHGASHVLRS